MSDLSKFYTREAENEGTTLPLHTPDGERTDFWIKIRGLNSDSYQKARSNMQREMARIAAVGDRADAKRMAESMEIEEAKLLFSLIISWNLSDPLSLESVVKLCKEAPQLADVINSVAGKAAYFFKKPASNSESSQNQASS